MEKQDESTTDLQKYEELRVRAMGEYVAVSKLYLTAIQTYVETSEAQIDYMRDGKRG